MKKQSPSVDDRVFQLDPDLRRARGFVEVWIGKRDTAGEYPTRKRWRRDVHFQSRLNPRKVLFVGAKLEPHFREVRDFEELLAFLHILALIDVLRDNGAAKRREDFRGQLVAGFLRQLSNLRRRQSQLREPQRNIVP